MSLLSEEKFNILKENEEFILSVTDKVLEKVLPLNIEKLIVVVLESQTCNWVKGTEVRL